MKKFFCIILLAFMFCFTGCEAEAPAAPEPTVTTEYYLGQLIETVYNADGSYVKNILDADGSIRKTEEYSTEGMYGSASRLIKRTIYAQDGSIRQIEQYEYSQNRETKIVYDGNGTEIERTEDYTERYDGGSKKVYKVIIDGTVTLLKSEEYRNGGLTIMLEERVTGTTTYKTLYTQSGQYENRYKMSETIQDGQILEYTCERDFKEGNVRSRKIVYLPETNTYQLTENTITNFIAGTLEDIITMIPAEDYVKADWEIFE